MEAKQPKRKKSSVRAQKASENIELYIDSAVQRVEKAILPKINELDNRDKLQYKTSVKYIESLEKRFEKHYDLSVSFIDKYDVIADKHNVLKENLDSLHNKIDNHLKDEELKFKELTNGLTTNAIHIESIQNTLDNVEANGRKGLSASMSDVYNKIKDFEQLTAGAKSRAKVWNAMSDALEKTPMLRPFTNKWGFIVYLLIITLILNTIIHALGIQWDLMGMFKWLFAFIKLGA